MISLDVFEILNRYESFELLCEALDSCFDLHELSVVDGTTQANYLKLSELSAISLYDMWKYVKEHKSLPPYINEANLNENYVTLYTYIEELVNCEDIKSGSLWFSVPYEWAQNKAKSEGFDSLIMFQEDYNYDDSARWLKDAINSSKLISFGVGSPLNDLISPQKNIQEENSMKNNMKLTQEDSLKIAKNYHDGDHAFYHQDLEEPNVKDAKKWLENGELVGIVSEIHGGIIGYIHADHADDIVSILNLYAIDRLK
ncbi:MULTISPECIES: hypothetical protein [Bacillus]|uniref:hypothetical protein n=1 Tax=Bacillus TaxID=1386 RepID=UPI0013BDFC9E|nr:hypothetical protein [Bacillus subtilis]KAF2423622.1 hypothetical protein B6K89_15785 [Bacillus subtilis]MEC0312028.1 hypothetical protein [Bacillus subtilis]MEC0363664.1 hypothetical protein [Bacillus subtilis]